MELICADPAALLSPLGQEVLARAAALRGDLRGGGGRSELAAATELRKEYPADLAAAAMAQQELREMARAKFTRAAGMLFTRGGYEQSSSEMIARHRSSRFAGSGRVADLCCGIGGDLIALAALPGCDVLAVDRDETHARFALHNAAVYGAAVYGAAVRGDGAGGGARACVADVRDVPLAGFDAAFIDPARRSDARGAGAGPGRFRAGVSEPPLEWCFALTAQVPAVCVKAAPGLPAELIPPGWEAEFIADGRDLKEAVLWSPAFAGVPSSGVPSAGAPSAGAGPRRATILPAGHTLVAVPGDPVPVAEPGEFLLDPSPAVTRAGLVEDLARTVGGWKIDQQIAFISVNTEVSTPFARTLRVIESAPWNEKRFAARLRELGVGAADLRRRGLAGDVDQIRRRLKLSGPHRATVVLTRVGDKPWGLICADATSPVPHLSARWRHKPGPRARPARPTAGPARPTGPVTGAGGCRGRRPPGRRAACCRRRR
ncbi:MAG: THUMP-like domain-containing protein [Trebonia sp.]